LLLRSFPKKNVGKDYEKNLKMETAILQKVHHPNIIELKELVDTKDYLYLIMELVTGGELFDKIVEKGSYTEADAAHLVHKIISAVLYLHESGIVHRDLKPENLLLKTQDDDKEVKNCRFWSFKDRRTRKDDANCMWNSWLCRSRGFDRYRL